ncbi:MAG TPA: hypothetical protein DIW81_18545 [Planctomycetaceae bacterium]|nr:hypothetical protein [Rubinisphaera sp.]HCS53561.1 hypothetical protein [Planctomycetaceae bacterium]
MTIIAFTDHFPVRDFPPIQTFYDRIAHVSYFLPGIHHKKRLAEYFLSGASCVRTQISAT